MKQTFKYPTSWSDVTLKQYYDLLDVIEIELNDTDKSLAILSALTGLEAEYINSQIPTNQLAKAIDALSFIKDKPDVSPKVSIKVKGRKLVFDMVLRDSNASSFISLSDCCKDQKTTQKNLHNIIAIFCYDVNFWGFRKKRTINNQKDIAEFLKNNLTMDYAFGYSSFFLTSYKKLLKSTADYLKRKQMKIAKELMKVTNQPL